MSLTVSSLYKLYQLYRLYEPNKLPSSLVRSYLSSRHKLYKLYELNELYKLNELHFQSLVRRYPSTDGRILQTSDSSLPDRCHVHSRILWRLPNAYIAFPLGSVLLQWFTQVFEDQDCR